MSASRALQMTVVAAKNTAILCVAAWASFYVGVGLYQLMALLGLVPR